MPTKPTAYHQNFIKGVRLIMANRNLETTKEAAEFIGINYMAMWKIMDGTNKPSVENCIKLLKKGKFNANWLFLSEGSEKIGEQMKIEEIINELSAIKKKIGVNNRG